MILSRYSWLGVVISVALQEMGFLFCLVELLLSFSLRFQEEMEFLDVKLFFTRLPCLYFHHYFRIFALG